MFQRHWDAYLSDPGWNMKLPADAWDVQAQKVQDDTVGLGRTAASSSGLVPKLYAALTFAFAGAGASYLFLSNETLTVCSHLACGKMQMAYLAIWDWLGK